LKPTFPMRTLLLLVATSGLAAATPHPVLFFGTEDIPKLRSKAKSEPFASMVTVLKMRASGELPQSEESGSPDRLMNDYRLRDDATLYLVTGEQKYSDRARELAMRMIADTEYWNNPRSKGLTRAAGLLSVTLAYDFCGTSWPEETRKTVLAAMTTAAENLLASMGEGANTKTGNNWQAVRYGAAGLAFLAAGSPDSQKRAWACYELLIKHLRANLGRGSWNPEGTGYTIYPWQFSGPFAIAAARAGIGDVRKDVPEVGKTLWTTLVATVPIKNRNGRGLHPDLSDDHPVYEGQGTAGIAFWLTEPAWLPATRWMYDRLVGGFGDGTWDSARGGALYSLLFYPTDIEAAPPGEPHGNAYVDKTLGVVVFRKSYKDEQDIVTLVNATSRRASGGHSGPDVNTLRLIGLGAPFIVGGGRTGDTAGQSNLFAGPPPKNDNGQLGKLVEVTLDSDGSGTAFVQGSCLGVLDHRRSVAVDYSEASGSPALICNGETSENGRLWRLNTPEFNSIRTEGRAIIIESPVGSTLVITVLEPENPVFRTGVVPRGGGDEQPGFPFHGKKYLNNKYVEFDCDRNVFVVMTLQRGEAPQVESVRSLHGITAKVGGHLSVMEWDTGRVLIGAIAAKADLASRKSPLRLAGLTATSQPDSTIEILWPTDQQGQAKSVRIERRSPLTKTAPWETAGVATFSEGRWVDSGCEPDQSHTYRAIAFNDFGDALPSKEVQAVAIARGLVTRVEDFAEGAGNSLGSWDFPCPGKHGLRPIAESGSEQEAKEIRGFLATPNLPIGTKVAAINRNLPVDLSAFTSEISVDFQASAAFGFRPLIQLEDGSWWAGRDVVGTSREGWRTIHLPSGQNQWSPLDLASLSFQETFKALPKEKLHNVQGLGVLATCLINGRSVKVDQLRIRAHPASSTRRSETD
jgi:hypothetical protein